MVDMATPPTVEWHGTPDEGCALADAVAKHCDCTFGLMGMRITTCTSHTAMVKDQRFMDGLVFMRRNRECLQRKEWSAYDPNTLEILLPYRVPVPEGPDGAAKS